MQTEPINKITNEQKDRTYEKQTQTHEKIFTDFKGSCVTAVKGLTIKTIFCAEIFFNKNIRFCQIF